MLACFTQDKENDAIPLRGVVKNDFKNFYDLLSDHDKNWVSTAGFKAKANTFCLMCDSDGRLKEVLVGLKSVDDFWALASLSLKLPENVYKLSSDMPSNSAIAWGLGAYQYTRYKKAKRSPAVLNITSDVDEVMNMVQSIYLTRDLINAPTEDLGPTELSDATKLLAKENKATFNAIVGDKLLKENYPCIHAVGRASDDAPRLLEILWGEKDHPKVTLVGKGVCFDSGGLDLKPTGGMLDMKKDMGGSAHVLGLARMIMQAKLPIRLRVLIAAVENVVSSNAYKPKDVLMTRKGLTVEVLNTDAEGRLVLCDALTEADSESPELLMDFATLTGAARVALGTEIPAFYCHDDALANTMMHFGKENQDPVWRMPLYKPYRELLDNDIADLGSCVLGSPYGGSITAALYLNEFVDEATKWIHFDIMASNEKNKPGRPKGAEAQSLRAVYELLKNQYVS